MYSLSFPITFIRLWNLDIETKGYVKVKDSRDEIHGYSLLDH